MTSPAELEADELIEENKTLKEEIIKLKKELDYNGHYNAFLLGTISEKEFEEITKIRKLGHRPLKKKEK